ncbi:hypothetical protein G3I27_31790, partial [Streptomyces sp. SID10692]|nr:hypothetical protein [Streptomyces sp. SID10692]
MLDTTPLIQAVDRFADRLRSAPQSRLQRGAAAEALAAARELAANIPASGSSRGSASGFSSRWARTASSRA